MRREREGERERERERERARVRERERERGEKEREGERERGREREDLPEEPDTSHNMYSESEEHKNLKQGALHIFSISVCTFVPVKQVN
jgi:hypothetical protein